jgi:hypothetical protein
MRIAFFSTITLTALAAAILPAHSQSPSISSVWDHTRLSQEQCLSTALATFERMKFTRIERIGNSVFADYRAFQLAFRCVAEKQLYYVYGGGPGDENRQLDKIVVDLKDEFNRR